MKNNSLKIFMALLLLVSLLSSGAQNPTEAQNILEKIQLANNYFMNKWPDTGKTIVTNKERPSNIWTRAVYYEGLMGLYSIDPKPEYLKYAVDWGESHKWGFRSGKETRNADDYCAGQTYIDLYLIDKKPERIADTQHCIDNLIALGEKSDSDWDWIDAIQMGMPVFAKLGMLYNENKYFDKMHSMYMHTRNKEGENGLFNKKDGLWWRDADFDPPYTEPNGEDCYWSRGNGWVYMNLTLVMDITKMNSPYQKQYLKDFKAMSKALSKIQRNDGTWNVSLHDPTNYGGTELTGTAMFVYGMAWGINHGVLSKKKYLPIIEKAWDGMINNCMHENGFLGFVQGTGKQPSAGQPVTHTSMPDFEDYGLGAFLLAGKEFYILKSK